MTSSQGREGSGSAQREGMGAAQKGVGSAHADPTQQDLVQQDRAWQDFVERTQRESLPFEDHLEAYHRIFDGRRPEDGPPAAWTPDEETVRRSNLRASMDAVGIDRYEDFHAWSVQDRPAFWAHTLQRLGVVFTRPPDTILDLAGGVRQPRWLPGAEMNIVDSCFTADRDRPAVFTPGADDDSLSTITYGELECLVNRLANGLVDRGLAPDRAIALYMPLSLECVTAYLAIIRAGSRVVSIADSFPAAEVRSRMAIAGADCIVTMDHIVRGGKTIPLYDTVVEAGASTVIVVPTGGRASPQGGHASPQGYQASPEGGHASPQGEQSSRRGRNEARIRDGDISWPDLFSSDDTFESVTGDPYRTTNVLFSSGTTGDPKAIPWTHLTPLKGAMDGLYHQDIRPGDVTAWPTNIGWMMGPWLIYATLVNGAAMALYPGTTSEAGYPRFIQRAGVTMLGVIPSLVRTWRHSGATDGVDWSSVRVFSSTGEPANRADYLWLMSRAGYRAPVIEYLGGTEIGGGHLACTVLQPCSPATFTTANLGVDFIIKDEEGREVEEGGTGELYLRPPALGMSQQLLNGDHEEVYYAGCPAGTCGEVLRRHGDHAQRLHHGYFRAQGRADDGMNLGGILVSPLDLERIVDGHPDVYESAAVAVQPEGEGAERLVIFIVPETGSVYTGAISNPVAISDPESYPDRDPAADLKTETMKEKLQAMISAELNPLFKIYNVKIAADLPHTASGKLVRRALRDQLKPAG